MNHPGNQKCTITRRKFNTRKNNRLTYNRLANPAYAGRVNHISNDVDASVLGSSVKFSVRNNNNVNLLHVPS